jgi:DNA-binding LacI/PurR family transcriptional regulator
LAVKGFITADDVARRAGVSRSAVSRTFTPGASVSAEVSARVRRASDELGYRINRLAQGLTSDRSNLVGIVVSNLGSPYISRQVDALSQLLLQHGLQCLLLNATDAEHDISPLMDLVLEFRVRAIVVMSGAPPSSIVERCVANGIQVILTNRVAEGGVSTVVASDDTTGAQLAAARLLRARCRRIAVVGGGIGTFSQMRRLNAFSAVVGAAGLEPVLWAQGATTYEMGMEAARAILQRTPDLDGVFCATDLLALGFLDVARQEFGRRIPEDISIVGFDDIPQAGWLGYSLTTIRLPHRDLARSILAKVVEPADHDFSVVPVELVERHSVRA